MSLFVWLQNATLCTNQWVNPIALEAAGWLFYFGEKRCSSFPHPPPSLTSLPLFKVFLGALIVYFIAIWFTFVETKGLSLEEVTLLFDHNEASSLQDKKDNVDAHFKLNNKQTEVRHLEDADKASF